MAEHAPTTEQMRHIHRIAHDRDYTEGFADWLTRVDGCFDRWLAAHDTEVEANALEGLRSVISPLVEAADEWLTLIESEWGGTDDVRHLVDNARACIASTVEPSPTRTEPSTPIVQHGDGDVTGCDPMHATDCEDACCGTDPELGNRAEDSRG